VKKRAIPRYLLDLSRQFRRESTPAEQILWEHLRGRRLDGAKFRRQAVIGRYIVDFYCHTHRLVIELDGAVHNPSEARAYDAVRQRDLTARGCRVLRFCNAEVERNLPDVLAAIRRAMRE
jgi:very-short-patch-repair endonuclease